jgi:pimeloyl-[acyl-carrier protein] methyl ester esterase
MLKDVFCFSGWAQNYNALEPLFHNKNCNLFSFNYSAFSSYKNFLNNVIFANKTPHILIGWSLGGQIALKLIAEKILQPKYLVLLAPPFQMIKNANISAGMSLEVAKNFSHNFATTPLETLKQFSILNSLHDGNSTKMLKNLNISLDNHQNWFSWLYELYSFSCFNLDFSNIPSTLYFHGENDAIVNIAQAQYFQNKIKNLHFYKMANCGHAPHLNNPAFLIKIMSQHCEI